MSIAQLSPPNVIANPGNVNPLAHATYNVSAAVAGSVAQQKTAQIKSDSVTISRQAIEKAAHPESQHDNTKEAQTRNAPEKTSHT